MRAGQQIGFPVSPFPARQASISPIPKSSATCAIVRPLVSVSRTASCLNSSVNVRLSRLPIGSSCRVQRYQKVPPLFPGKSNDRLREGVNEWVVSELLQRLNNRANSAMVLVMQRVDGSDIPAS